MKAKHTARAIVEIYHTPNIRCVKAMGTVFEEIFTDMNAKRAGRAEKAKL
jgi:hypothetical protein